MAGGKHRLPVTKLAEKRDGLLRKANKWFLKATKLEAEAIELDIYISENCDHPKKHLKLKRFSKGIPQKSMWLCTLCFQGVETGSEKKKKAIEKSIEENFAEAIDEIPNDKIKEEKEK